MRSLHSVILTITILTLFLGIQLSSAASLQSKTDYKLNLKKRHEPVKPGMSKVSPDADLSRVVIKFKEGSDIRLRRQSLISLKGKEIGEVNRLLGKYLNSGRLAKLIDQPEKKLSKMKSVFEINSGHELADFNLYYQINITDPSEAQNTVNSLNKLDIVEIAYVEPKAEVAEDIDPPTPNYEPYQYYRIVAPTGVDADYANTLPGGDGTGVKIIDIEHNWNETHEDLEKALGGSIGPGYSQYGDHGTAVLGEMIGGDNGYGVTGICPGADVGMVSAGYYGTSNAILIAADTLQRGDLMLIELHAPGPRYDFQVRSDQLGYVCMEYWQDNFDALQYAWTKGIIVIEAAGNGAENYDDVIYGPLFDTTYRNSGAIMAGAGAPPSGTSGPDRSRLDFSNHGERVNLQGYGREVFTTGYGGYFDGGGDPNQYYTSSFSGTSSASPIVTGAVACLQGYYKANYGAVLTSAQALAVLNATGSPQQGDTTGQHIGPRPDLAAAIPALSPPPSLYTEPVYFDTTLEQGEAAVKSLWLYNRSDSYAVDFSINDNDSLLKIANWLSVSPSAGTVGISDSVELSVTIDASEITDRLEVYKGILEISWGVSSGTLDSLALVPTFLQVPCLDDTTFTVASGNDPEGPAYNWVEIKYIGTPIPYDDFYNGLASNPLDDGSAGPFSLPFDFDFYGTGYNQYYVGVNGGLSFTDSDVNSGGYYGNLDIPGNGFSTFISVFWNDLIIGDYSHGGGHGNIYLYNSPGNDTTIIEWYQVGNFNSSTDTLTTFQVILTSYGNITMQYQNVGVTGLENTALVGISEIECTAEPYFDTGVPAENTPANMSVVSFTQAIQPTMSGDCDGSGAINILDATYLIAYLYLNGPAPNPEEDGDANCSGAVNILDVTYLINYLYKGGPAPCLYY